MSFLLSLLSYLKLKKPPSKYTIEVVKDKNSLRGIYRFRYKMYCLVDKLLNKEDFPQGFETDEYDEYSVHFAILDQNRKIIGTARLIKNSNLYFPTAKDFNLSSKLKKIQLQKMVEISRFIIIPKYRKTLLGLDLFKAIYLYSKEHGIEYYLGCGEEWFVKKIEGLFGKINIIGEPRFCFNATNYPFLLNIKSLEERVRRKQKILFGYFNSKTKTFKF